MKTAPLRAAIYARYSTDMQSPDSVRDQIELCRRYAKKEGWSVVEHYSDAAISGSSSHRPDYRRLLGDLGSGAFDIVLVEALDRLSRDQEDTAHFYKHARHHGVALYSVERGEVDTIQIGPASTFGALYIEGVSQKTHRGLEGRIAKGKSAGGLSYGYRIARDPSGAPLIGELEIDQDQALIVRRIFEEYAAGKSPLAIAAALNAEVIPAPRHSAEKPKFWKQNTINGNRPRGTGILNNELYIGKRVWNRQRFSKHPTTDKRVARLRDPSEWLRSDAPALRIVDDELWQAVKARQDRQSKERSKKPSTDRNGLSTSQSLRRRKYLLSGLLTCGRCGGSLTMAGEGRRKRYYCANAKEKGPAVCAGMPGLLQDAAEQTVLRGLREQLLQDTAYATFQRRFQQHLEESTSGRDDEIEMVERRIREKEREQSSFIRIVALGTVNEALAANLNAVEEDLKRLRAQRKELEPVPITLPDNLPELYRRYVAGLVATLSGEEVHRAGQRRAPPADRADRGRARRGTRPHGRDIRRAGGDDGRCGQQKRREL